jgi:hypothetical protein
MPLVGNARYTQYAQILAFALLCAVNAFIIKPLNDHLQSRIWTLQTTFIEEVETILRRHVSYDSIGTHLLSVVDIKNLAIHSDDADLLLSIPRLKIQWSIAVLINLLFEKNYDAIPTIIGRISLENPTVNLDMNRDKDLLDLLASLQTDQTLELAEGLPLNIRNGAVFITTEDNEWITSTGIQLEARVVNRRIAFKATTSGNITLNDTSASASIVISGITSADFKNINATATLLSFSSDLFSLRTMSANPALKNTFPTALSFNISASEESIHAFTISNPFPFDLSLDYQPGSKELSLALATENFTPSDFVSLSGDLQQFQQYLGVTLSGSASFNTQDSGIQYTASLTGSLPSDFPTGKANFVIKGRGDEDSAALNEVTLQTPQGVFGFRGSVAYSPFALNGRVSVSNFALDRYKRANASFIAIADTKNASLRGEYASLDKTILKTPEIYVSFGEKSLDWSLSIEDIFFEGEGDENEGAEAEEKKIVVDGVLDYNPRYVDAHLVLNDVALSKLFDAAKSFVTVPELPLVEDVLDKAVIRTEAFFSTDFSRFSYNVPNINVVYHDSEKEQNVVLASSLAGTDRRLDLDIERIAWNNGSVDGRLFVNFTSQNNTNFGLSFSYLLNNYNIQGSILDNSISIQGSYGINAFLVLEDGLSGYIETVNIPFSFQERNATLSVRAFLRYETTESWSVDVEHFEVANLWTPISPSNTVRFAAYIDQDGVQSPTVFWNDGTSALSGGLSLDYAGFSEIAGTLSLSDETGEETYLLDFACTDVFSESRSVAAHLQGVGMQAARFTKDAYGATISGNVDVDWRSLEDFATYVELSSVSAVINDVNVRFKGAANIDDSSAEIRDIEAYYGSLNVNIPSMQISLGARHMETAMAVAGTALGRAVELGFTLDLDFDTAIDSWSSVGSIVDAFKGHLTVDNVRFDALKTESPFTFEFSHVDKTMNIAGGPDDMLRLSIADSGDFYAGLSAPLPIRGSINGSIDAKNIDAVCRDLYIDLAALWKLVPPQKDIALAGGFVNANVEIRGPLASPEFFGQAVGNSVCIQVPTYLQHDIRPVPMIVMFNGTNMSFGPVPASIDMGYGMVSGVFHFDRWVPDVFTINIAVEEENAIPFAFDIMGVIASGDAFGELILAQSDGIFHVSGDLTAENSEVTLNGDELEAAQNQPMDAGFPTIVNITVRTGSKVEFLWPTAAFPLIHAYSDQGVSLSIQSDTITGRFALEGDVRLRSGEIFYFERSFYIREGLLTFNENEVRFEPHISARAEVRDISDEGAVTISMVIDNSPLWSFNPRFESNPPLSQMAIFELLGQTMMGGGDEGGSSGRLAGLSSLTDMVAQIQGVRLLEIRLRNWLHLDMFSLRTQFVQNFLFSSIFQSWDQDREQSGYEPESSSRPGNLFDNTTVFIGKYLTKDLFVQLLLSLRYDEATLNLGGLTLEPDFGLELQNPLFDMRWSLVPLHPENLFVNDMSLTLTWSKNF